MREEALAKLARELKIPLQNALGFLELLAHPTVGELNAKQQEFLGDALASVLTAKQILEDIKLLCGEGETLH